MSGYRFARCNHQEKNRHWIRDFFIKIQLHFNKKMKSEVTSKLAMSMITKN